MDKTDQQANLSLLHVLDSEGEAETLEILLSSVRRQKRIRTVQTSLGIAAILCLGGLAITFQSETSPAPQPDFSEINVPGNWTDLESSAQFTEIKPEARFAFEQIESSAYGPIQRLNEEGLLNSFKGPLMLAQVSEEFPKHFWLLDENTLQ